LSDASANAFTYDPENRLTQSAISGATTQYGYDGAGNRLSRKTDGVTIRYVLDRSSTLPNVLAETDGNGDVTAYYVHGHGLISKILPDNTARYYLYDSRGSAVALTDASGNITDTYLYGTFGDVNNRSGTTKNTFTYLGRHGVMDEGNGLYYVRARYYMPETGRFLTKDMLTGKDADPQTLNRYVYALNNPIRLIDISGFSAKEGGAGQTNSKTSDELHRGLVDKVRLARLNSLKAQYDYIAALETEAAYWDAMVNTLEGVYGALNAVGGLLTGSWSSVTSGMVTMGGALTQAAGMDKGWHTTADLVSTGLDVYGLASSAQNFYKALDGRTAQARALDLDVTTKLTSNMTRTTREAISMGSDFISTSIDCTRIFFEGLF